MTEQTKQTVTIFTIIISLLPAIFLVKPPAAITASTITLYLSAIVGYWGIVLLLWMYLLGTRAVTGTLFRDIAPVLTIHKWLGKYGILAVVMHPLLITLAYGESWLYSFIPHTATLADRHILLGQIALWMLLLTWVLSVLLRNRMAFRPWKYLHYLAYVCVPFAILHVPDLGSQQMSNSFLKAYLLLLGVIFVAFTLLRIRSLLNLDKLQYRVVEHTAITTDDYAMTLAPMGTRYIAPRFGHYVYLKLAFLSEDHPFSVAHYDDKTHKMTIVYRRYGMYTNVMNSVAAGSLIYLAGPYGTFTDEIDRQTDLPVVYISGGIGITPFIDRIMTEQQSREQWLFAANRTPDTAVLVTTLKKRLGERCVSFYSRYDGMLGPQEERGHIRASALAHYLGDPKKYAYYLCGPAPMIAGLRHELESIGVAKAHLHNEEFGW